MGFAQHAVRSASDTASDRVQLCEARRPRIAAGLVDDPEAGGFPAYERLQRGKLIATATKMLGHRLPPSIIPTVVKFWGHPGEYASRGHDPWNPGPVFY